MRPSRFTEGQIIGMLKEQEAGAKTADVCRKHGIIDPIASMEGEAALIGAINPASHFVTVSRGAFSKALGFEDLTASLLPLLAAGPVLLVLSVSFLRKQAR